MALTTVEGFICAARYVCQCRRNWQPAYADSQFGPVGAPCALACLCVTMGADGCAQPSLLPRSHCRRRPGFRSLGLSGTTPGTSTSALAGVPRDSSREAGGAQLVFLIWDGALVFGFVVSKVGGREGDADWGAPQCGIVYKSGDFSHVGGDCGEDVEMGRFEEVETADEQRRAGVSIVHLLMATTGPQGPYGYYRLLMATTRLIPVSGSGRSEK